MTDSPLDYSVKKNLIRDTFHILNLSWKRKNKYISNLKNDMANRLAGKQRANLEEREAQRLKKQKIKDKFEQNNLGDFQNLYPLKRGLIVRHDELMDEYDYIYKQSRIVYEETTQGGYVPSKPRRENPSYQNDQSLISATITTDTKKEKVTPIDDNRSSVDKK